MSELSGLAHPTKCSICGCDYDEEAGGLQGYFGILPVTLCEFCLPCMMDMADQLNELGEEDE